MNLPIEFTDRMKEYLGERYNNFLDSYEKPPVKGIRINTKKTGKDTVAKYFDVFKDTPYSSDSFVTDTEKVGTMPIFLSGGFYSQEPSASLPVVVLNPNKDDKVLDLCAAPGGKSTQIATYLGDNGLLWSNEIVKSRANILLSNIERMGIDNAVISNAHPDTLCSKLQGFFDKVLVDAPCSGEGMFRKNPTAIQEWSLEHVNTCAVRQLEILNSASKALKKNGVLVYSTCTFSKEENEYLCEKFVETNKDFELASIDIEIGEKVLNGCGIRLYPNEYGEGHFVAKFIKINSDSNEVKPYKYKESDKQAVSLYNSIFKGKLDRNIEKFGSRYIILPNNLPVLNGINVIRAGVELGEEIGKRIEPSHSIFMAHAPEECNAHIDLTGDEKTLTAYLKGEEIDCDCKGYTAVAFQSMVLGFGKASNGRLKNKYPKGLRIKV